MKRTAVNRFSKKLKTRAMDKDFIMLKVLTWIRDRAQKNMYRDSYSWDRGGMPSASDSCP